MIDSSLSSKVDNNTKSDVDRQDNENVDGNLSSEADNNTKSDLVIQ
jgi:hypothetical protein